MKTHCRDLEASCGESNTQVNRRAVETRKKGARILLYTLAGCFILAVASSLTGQSIEVVPQELCFVIEEDGNIAQKVRIRCDFVGFSSFQVVYKPEAIRVIGLDKLSNSREVVELDVILEVPEGAYTDTKELCERLTDERIRKLEMKGERVSKRELPSMSMFSRLEILMVGDGVDTYTIKIPLKAVFRFFKKGRAVSYDYVE